MHVSISSKLMTQHGKSFRMTIKMKKKGKGNYSKRMEKRCLIKSKPIIFFQFSTKKLFTLKLIIYISSHAICFELLYTSMNLEIDSINKFVL
jgi:stalled ribosome alternative rescue factor ArfA